MRVISGYDYEQDLDNHLRSLGYYSRMLDHDRVCMGYSLGMGMRFHISAWGSSKEPDLDYDTNEIPPDLNWRFPFVHVSTLQHINKDWVLAANATNITYKTSAEL